MPWQIPPWTPTPLLSQWSYPSLARPWYPPWLLMSGSLLWDHPWGSSLVRFSLCWCRPLTTVEENSRGVEVGVVIYAALLVVFVVTYHVNQPLSIPLAISVLGGSLSPFCRSMSHHRHHCRLRLNRPKPVPEWTEERRNKSG